MRYLVAVMGIAALVAVLAGPWVGSEARGQELIRALKLEELPKESGYLGIIGRWGRR